MLLSVTHDADVFFGTTDSPQKSLKKGIELAEKAISLDASNSVAYGQLGLLYIRLKEYDKAVELARTCAPLGPSNFEANRMAAQVLARAGKVEEALPLLDNAVRLNPVPRYTFLIAAASIYHQARNYEKALQIYKMAARLEPKNTGGYAGIAATSSLMGKMEEARAAIAELRRVDPNYSLEQVKKTLVLRGDKDQEAVSRFIQGLRSAGIPETPPLSIQPSTKTTIAVLPFQNMMGDPQQDYLCDGMAEQLITGLSQTPDIYVIARTSSFTYRGKAMTAQQIAGELGVRYLIEGSVQRSSDRLRIHVQLIDGKSGEHVWAERYDRKFDDLFALQDQIAMEVMSALNVKFSGFKSAGLEYSRPSSIKAYEYFLKGLHYHLGRRQQDFPAAREMLEEAIKLDPNYGAAYRWLGFVCLDEINYRMTKSFEKSIGEAEWAAQKSREVDPEHPPYGLMSAICRTKKDFDGAVQYAEKLIETESNNGGAHFTLGVAYMLAGRYAEAITSLETAIRLVPVKPPNYLTNLGRSYLGNRQYDKAVLVFSETLERYKDFSGCWTGLTVAYELSGNHERAMWAAENVMRVAPKFSVASEGQSWPYKDQEFKSRFHGALRSAGLK